MHPYKSINTLYNMIAVLYFPIHVFFGLGQILMIGSDFSTLTELFNNKVVVMSANSMMSTQILLSILIGLVFVITPLQRILYKFPWLTPCHIILMFLHALIASTYYILAKAYEVQGGGNNIYIFLAIMWFIIGRGIMSFVFKKYKILYIGEYDNATK